MSRREWILSLAAAQLIPPGKGARFPSHARELVDGATENRLLRLTPPDCSSRLPRWQNAALDRRGRNLLYVSDLTGAPQAFRMDLRTFESRQLTDFAALDSDSLAALPGDHAFACFDGDALKILDYRGAELRTACRTRPGWRRLPEFTVSADGLHAFFVESDGKRWEIRMASLRRNEVRTVVGREATLRFPLPWPGRMALVYEFGGELWTVHYSGEGNRRLRTQEPAAPVYLWSPARRSLFYLTERAPGKLVQIRELFPDTNEDKRVGTTTQFATLAGNRDASVFAGASGSRASPYVLLFFRAVNRELTLCEHRASDPLLVQPVFTPDSQRLLFTSDGEGKPAVYLIDVRNWVEETPDAQGADRG